MKAWNNGHEQAQCSKDGDHDDDWHEMERKEEAQLTAPERRRLIGSAGSASVPIKAAFTGLDIYFPSTLSAATNAFNGLCDVVVVGFGFKVGYRGVKS